MSTHILFPICGFSFQNEPGFQKDGKFLWLGVSNRGREHPVGWGIQRGQRSLGGKHPMEGSTLHGGKNPMKPAVSWHTTLRAKSSVLYLWRPWVAERGCSGQKQAFQATNRVGGATMASADFSQFVVTTHFFRVCLLQIRL